MYNKKFKKNKNNRLIVEKRYKCNNKEIEISKLKIIVARPRSPSSSDKKYRFFVRY